MHRNWMRRLLGLSVFALFVILLSGLPLVAQDGGTLFATNTPAPAGADALFATNTPPAEAPVATAVPLFATNTPSGMEPIRQTGPAAPLFNYGLRLWFEQDLLTMISNQIATLQAGDDAARRALQVSLYELETRFPGSPRALDARRALVAAMLAAPDGMIDMRSTVRPLIEAALNANPGVSQFNTDGFDVALIPANLDQSGEQDAVVQITYRRDGVVLYDEYLLALRNGAGYRLAPVAYNLYAAPFDTLRSVTLYTVADVNRDSLDEVVLQADDGQVNRRMLIIAIRNGSAVELVQPGTEIRFGQIASWSFDNPEIAEPDLNVLTLRAESRAPGWDCVSQQEYTWRYERNFYRQSTDLNARFRQLDSLGCTLLNAEPIFALPPAEAISLVEGALIQYTFDAPDAHRALMTLAMLYALEGRIEDARNTAQAILPADETESWDYLQASAMLRALGLSSNTALDICAALAVASPDPACDVQAVVGRYLGLVQLNTTDDLAMQLANYGFPVQEIVRVSEIGRADRLVASFALPDSGWWGFVARPDGVYRAEPADAPYVLEASDEVLEAIMPLETTYAALLADFDPANALLLLDNQRRENPGVPLSAAGLYVQALAFELTGSRENARQGYYDVWQRYPDSVWGQLAAQHLEQR